MNCAGVAVLTNVCMPGFYGYFPSLNGHGKILSICIDSISIGDGTRNHKVSVSYRIKMDSRFIKTIVSESFKIECSLPLKGRIFFHNPDATYNNCKPDAIPYNPEVSAATKNIKRYVELFIDYALELKKSVLVTHIANGKIITSDITLFRESVLDTHILCPFTALYNEKREIGIKYESILSLELGSVANAEPIAHGFISTSANPATQQ